MITKADKNDSIFLSLHMAYLQMENVFKSMFSQIFAYCKMLALFINMNIYVLVTVQSDVSGNREMRHIDVNLTLLLRRIFYELSFEL